jgi:hypothetical protein
MLARPSARAALQIGQRRARPPCFFSRVSVARVPSGQTLASRQVWPRAAATCSILAPEPFVWWANRRARLDSSRDHPR